MGNWFWICEKWIAVEFIGGKITQTIGGKELDNLKVVLQVSRLANKKPPKLININEDRLSSKVFEPYSRPNYLLNPNWRTNYNGYFDDAKG